MAPAPWLYAISLLAVFLWLAVLYESYSLVQMGLGIRAMMIEIARDTPGIVRVLEEVPPVRFPLWLVTHQELRTSRPLRAVFEALSQSLAVAGMD